MFYLDCLRFKNFRLVLTTKFLILITKNGIVKFHTNFYQLYYYKKIIYLNLQNYNFNYNYLIDFFYGIYHNIFPEKLHLIVQGIGYKFIYQQHLLKIRIGYSHFIDYALPQDIFVTLLNPTNLIIYSNNKLIVTKIASYLKLQKKINPYKGTGIFYQIESINLKKKNTNKNKNAK